MKATAKKGDRITTGMDTPKHFPLPLKEGCMRALILPMLWLSLLPNAAWSHSKDSIEDPPNLFQFQSIQLKTVALSKVDVSNECDENYRLIMESAAQSIWKECTAIGKSEPSDCQRNLFQNCTGAANRLRALQPRTCAIYQKEESQVQQSTEKFADQTNTQETNSKLNEKANLASKRIGDQLISDAGAVSNLRKQTEISLKGGLCLLNTSAAEYLNIETKILTVLKNTEGRLKELSSSKIQNSKDFQTVASSSEKNVKNMESSKTSNATDTRANSNLGAYEGSSNSSSSKNSILKAAAVGLPAAALMGLAASSGSSFKSPMVGEVDTSTYSGAPLPPKTTGFITHEGLYIDPSFTDRQRAIILAAYDRVPDCQKSKLKNISIHNQALPKQKNSCIAGLWSFRNGQERIFLTPFCSKGISATTTLHEFFHALGFRNGRKLYSLFDSTVRTKHPNCHVTNYAATSSAEDFSESGRLAFIPENQAYRLNNPCIMPKIASTKDLVNSCQ
jgi:hypothetical protein